MKKFELVAELSKEFFGRKLFRIRALISFGDIYRALIPVIKLRLAEVDDEQGGDHA